MDARVSRWRQRLGADRGRECGAARVQRAGRDQRRLDTNAAATGHLPRRTPRSHARRTRAAGRRVRAAMERLEQLRRRDDPPRAGAALRDRAAVRLLPGRARRVDPRPVSRSGRAGSEPDDRATPEHRRREPQQPARRSHPRPLRARAATGAIHRLRQRDRPYEQCGALPAPDVPALPVLHPRQLRASGFRPQASESDPDPEA